MATHPELVAFLNEIGLQPNDQAAATEAIRLLKDKVHDCALVLTPLFFVAGGAWGEYRAGLITMLSLDAEDTRRLDRLPSGPERHPMAHQVASFRLAGEVFSELSRDDPNGEELIALALQVVWLILRIGL